MKRNFTLLLILLFFSATLQAQILRIDSPLTIEGLYIFDVAAFGGALDTIWTGCGVVVDDGTAMPSEGCNALINGAELMGNIAIIDRGSCEFGLKCKNAEDAGAIACIVANNVPLAGTFSMGPGVVGGQVTIPCVMISYEDGQIIKNALANDVVKITLGDIPLPNDLDIQATSVIVPPLGVVPEFEVENAGDIVVNPGATITNNGINTATNSMVTATIMHAPIPGGSAVQVYQEASTPVAMIAPDSTSDLILLPDFQPTAKGQYDIIYDVVSDSAEDLTVNNTYSAQLTISENMYCLGRWNHDEDRPIATIGYTVAGGGPIEFLAPLTVPYGLGYQIDSLIFSVSVNAPATLANISVTGSVYEWVDANADDVVNNDELFAVAIGFHTFDPANTNSQEWLLLPVVDFSSSDPSYVIDGDDKQFLIGVRYEEANTVFFGFDEATDYTQYIEFKGANVTDFDLPYIGTNAWDGLIPDIEAGFLFAGVRGAVATGIFINPVPSSTIELSPQQLGINIYPNPVRGQALTADVTMEAPSTSMIYRVTDVNGRIHVNNKIENINTEHQLSVDVVHLASGQYFLTLIVDQGSRTVPFVVEK